MWKSRLEYLGDSLYGHEPARSPAGFLRGPHARQGVHEVGAVLRDAPLREELNAGEDRGEERGKALRGEQREPAQRAGTDLADSLQEVV